MATLWRKSASAINVCGAISRTVVPTARVVASLGFGPVLEGLCSIARRTQAHQKYHHLLEALSRLGFVAMPDGIEAFLYPTPKSGLAEKLRALTPLRTTAKVEIVYVQPVASPGDRCIDFETFAKHVERMGDPVSVLFSAYLRRWTGAAGASRPYGG